MDRKIPKIKNTELKIVASAGAVHYGNGYFFKPFKLGDFSAASTKTLTLEPRAGNFRWHKPWETIKPIDNDGNVNYFHYTGFVNSVGFSNIGIEKWIEDYYEDMERPENIIVSVAGSDTNEFISMVSSLNELDILAIEPNFTCPNDKSCVESWMTDDKIVIETLKMICSESRHPVVLKLSARQNYINIATALKNDVKAISINSVPWKMIFPEKRSPLERFGGGGVSGRVARPFTWGMALSLSRAVDIPVIIPGIWEATDLRKIKNMDRWNLVPSIGSSSIPPPFLKALGIIKEAQRPRKI